LIAGVEFAHSAGEKVKAIAAAADLLCCSPFAISARPKRVAEKVWYRISILNKQNQKIPLPKDQSGICDFKAPNNRGFSGSF